MNLLEKAMRQKAIRASRQNGQAAETETPAASLPATRPLPVKLLLAGGAGITLATAAIGMLLAPTDHAPANASPTQAMFAPKNIDQFATAPDTPVKGDEGRQNVATFVDGWVRAWSAKDVDKYLSAYAPEFKPAHGLSRPAWEKQRRERLAKYKKIEVALANLTIAAEKDTATVEFIQSFKADDFSESGLRKRLDLRLQDSRWVIVRETSS
ncbi:MAG: nuclear transport factor 2 family protein [Nitrosomonadales bacterium]|nr:nuclear transport factor 2 family protein [Nitrosomonadales bacterium]